MSNNTFFKSFFDSKNTLWKEIQNNPIAHETLLPSWYQSSISYRLVDNAGQDYPNVNIDENVQYYPGAIPLAGGAIGPPGPAPIRTRVYRDNIKWRDDWFNFGQRNFADWEARKYILENIARKPAPGTALPDPLVGGLNANQRLRRSYRNVISLLSMGRFALTPRDRFNDPDRFKKANDYWFPYFEGKWEDIPEKAVKKPPQKYNRDLKFLGNKPFMKPKQKESLVWLECNFG